MVILKKRINLRNTVGAKYISTVSKPLVYWILNYSHWNELPTKLINIHGLEFMATECISDWMRQAHCINQIKSANSDLINPVWPCLTYYNTEPTLNVN